MQEVKYQGNYITVTEEEINGHVFERIKLRKGVYVIPYREDGKILLIHEKRIHENGSRWKLISGWVDKKNKSILEHAQEELAEEIGYEASEWKEFYNSDFSDKTYSSSNYYFTCTHLSPLENPPQNPDSGAVLAHEWFSFEEIFDLIHKKKILMGEPIMVALSFLHERFL